jgi:serine/threonine protein kinase
LPAFVKFNGADFERGAKIGQGGMGSIYHATSKNSELIERVQEAQIVVKVLTENVSQLSSAALTTFHQEVALTWKFQKHPNIVKMYGWSETPAAMILRFYPCGDLRHFIKRGSDTLDYHKTNIISVMLQIGSAVSFMHRENVVHCDLKPANILLDFDPVKCTIIAVLTDLGIARILDESFIGVEAFEVANANGLSTSYASPESFTRFKTKFHEASPVVYKLGDVYSLSIILLEMMVRGDAWDLEHRLKYGLARPTFDPLTEMPHI